MNRRVFTIFLLTASVIFTVHARAQDTPSQTGTVYIEDSPAAQEMIAGALALAANNRPNAAVRQFQQAIEQYPHKLTVTTGSLYTDTSRWIEQYLEKHDDLLAAYRQAYDPVAQGQLDKALNPRVDGAALNRLLSKYYLTQAGLTAGLDLAALHLEAAQADAAMDILHRLAGHPDLAQSTKRYDHLLAVAALVMGDHGQFSAIEKKLRSSGSAEEADALKVLAGKLPSPPAAQVAKPIPLPPAAAFKAPLWSYQFTSHAAAPQMVAEGVFGQRRGLSSRRSPLAPVPMAAGDTLFINANRFIIAFDRDSGRQLWQYQAKGRIDPQLLPMLNRMGRIGVDSRSVAAAGDRVFAIVGRTVIWPGPSLNADTGETALVCLDRRTGKLLWRVTPAQLGDNVHQAAFHGTPVVSRRLVFGLIRRNQTAGFRAESVVAFDARTGRLVWRRHIASTAEARRFSSGLPGRMMAADGKIYVTDARGAVACIDARTGVTDWLRLLPDPPAQVGRGDSEAAGRFRRYGPPVLVRAGLIVPVSPGNQQVLLLDPASGRLIKTLTGTPWDRHHRLMSLHGDVLAVGDTAMRLNGQTLKPIWTVQLPAASESSSDDNENDLDASAHGMAAVTTAEIVVPTNGQIVFIRLSDGKIVRQQAVPHTGNILALSDQLVMATADGIQSYMTWPDALGHLATRIKGEPLAVGPALDLASLALITGHEQATLGAVDHALAVLDRAQTKLSDQQLAMENEQVFSALDQFAAAATGASRTLRQGLFHRMAQVAATPRQQVRYHLHAAKFDASIHEPVRAAGHYQAILEHDDLTRQIYHGEVVVHTAGQEARRRLGLLIDQEGSRIYDRFRREAEARFKVLLADPSAGPSSFIDLAMRYPFAKAAIGARLRAAAGLADTGQVRQAVIQLRWAYENAEDYPQMALAASKLAELLEDRHQPRRAIAWLERVKLEHTTLQLTRRGKPIATDEWQSELEKALADGVASPEVKLPLIGVRALAERVVPLSPQANMPTRQSSQLLLIQGDRVICRNGAKLDIQWTAPIAMSDPHLLDETGRAMVLVSPSTGDLVALDRQTGEALWRMADIKSLLDQVAGRPTAGREAQENLTNMLQIAPLVFRGGRLVVQHPKAATGYLVAASDLGVCVSDRQGRVIAVDPDAGRILWRAVVPMDKVTHLAINDQVLVLAGESGVRAQMDNGSMVALDMLTGEPRFPAMHNDQPADWVGLGGAGLVIRVSDNHVTAYHLQAGRLAWRRDLAEDTRITGSAWAGASQIILINRASRAICLNPVNGDVLAQVQLALFNTDNPIPGQIMDGEAYVCAPGGVAAIAADGTISWRDAIHLPNKHLVAQLVAAHHVVVCQADGATKRLYVLDRQDGRIVDEYALGANSETGQDVTMRLAAGNVILGGKTRTYILSPG